MIYSPKSTVEGLESYGRSFAKAGGSEVDRLVRNRNTDSISLATYASPPYNLNVPGLQIPRLCLNLTAAQVCGGFRGDTPKRFDTKRYSLFLTPAGAEAHWRKEAWSRHLNIYFAPSIFAGEDENTLTLDCDTPVFNLQVQGTRYIADLLVAELERPDALSVEATDSLARLLLMKIARRRHGSVRSRPSFSQEKLNRLRDYVVGNLDKRILVADLAKVAGMTPNHFAHVFSEHMGQPPHQFVLKLRLQKAMHMLQQSTSSLIDIALVCGFSSQQHLTQTMRLHTGTTPNRYRAKR